jgi:hypothetical protein
LIHSALVDVDPMLRPFVESELLAGEQLVWAAQPVPRGVTAGNVAIILFAIPWTAFAIFWTTMAFVGTRAETGHNGFGAMSLCFPLFGVPFILIGLAMFASPLFVRRSLKRTVYAITNRRALVFSPTFVSGRRVQSFEPERLTSMERIERRDGSGDLIFEQFITRRGSGTQTTRRGFMSVPRVREVEETLRKTLLANRVRTVE